MNPVDKPIPALAADWPCRRPWTSVARAPGRRMSSTWAVSWTITEVEDNKHYRATLDALDNGSYTWQGGQLVTTEIHDRHWRGTWKQPGNDRKGGFEVVLSEDGSETKGIWWYTRVGTKDHIPPRQHGGSYVWRRPVSAPPVPT